ncbi:MAG: 50S ribosomal protein L9 [Elusimicrobiota bacterium]
MKVILKQEIKGLGKIGDIKSVKDGYARNFLMPKGLVLPANDENLKIIEKEKIKVAEIKIKELAEVTEFAKKLSSVSVTIPVESGEENKIFGSVSSSDISAALKIEGFDIDKKSIILENPLKELGAFDVTVKVHPEVTAKIKVWVVKKAGNRE